MIFYNFRDKSDYDRWYNLLGKKFNRDLKRNGFASEDDECFWNNVYWYTALINHRMIYHHYRLEPIVTAILLTGITMGLAIAQDSRRDRSDF